MGILDWWKKRGAAAPPDDDGIPIGAIVTEREPTARKVGTSAGGSARYVIDEYRYTLDTKRGPIAVRTFTTVGLVERGVNEVRITVPADWSDATAEHARGVLVIQERFVAGGQPAVLGGYTGFQVTRDGRPVIVRVIYARGTEVLGIPGSADALAAVHLEEEEFEIVMKGMSARVLGRLALRARFFPYPPWWEHRARPVISQREQASSMVPRIGCQATAGDVRVTGVGKTIEISVPSDAAARTFAQLTGDEEMFLVHAEVAPDADAQYVWLADGGAPAATTAVAQPTRFAFAFVLFASGSPSAVKTTEDGVSMLLPRADMARVLAALRAGDGLVLDVADTTIKILVRRD